MPKQETRGEPRRARTDRQCIQPETPRANPPRGAARRARDDHSCLPNRQKRPNGVRRIDGDHNHQGCGHRRGAFAQSSTHGDQHRGTARATSLHSGRPNAQCTDRTADPRQEETTKDTHRRIQSGSIRRTDERSKHGDWAADTGSAADRPHAAHLPERGGHCEADALRACSRKTLPTGKLSNPSATLLRKEARRCPTESSTRDVQGAFPRGRREATRGGTHRRAPDRFNADKQHHPPRAHQPTSLKAS
jgi:hypothetical protein